VATIYPGSQGGTVFAHGSPILYAYYTLAQINRPARLLTEDEIAAGALEEVKALLVVGQTAALPAATVKAIDAFVQDGGKLLVDKNTKLELTGATKMPEVGWPGGLWPRYCNTFHEAIAELPRTLGAPLKAALGDIGKQPLDGDAVLVATKRAGSTQLLFVTNNREYPFADIFTPEQRLSGFYRNFLGRGGIYIKDVREPQVATLALREDLAESKPLIYDVFAGKQLVPVEKDGRWTVAVDLTTLPGRVLLLVDKPLAAPGLDVSQAAGSARATFVAKSAVPLPVRLRVGSQEIYRAATPAGSCDTLVLGPAAGAETVELTELITGDDARRARHRHAPRDAPGPDLGHAADPQGAGRQKPRGLCRCPPGRRPRRRREVGPAARRRAGIQSGDSRLSGLLGFAGGRGGREGEDPATGAAGLASAGGSAESAGGECALRRLARRALARPSLESAGHSLWQ
jgi:hypothetical protein